MNGAEDLIRIQEQEAALIYPAFDEASAFSLGCRLRDRALREGAPVVVEIRFWDRLLFYCALPGSTASNAEWARRKINVVRLYGKSTYRLVLEQNRPDRTFAPGVGLDPRDHVLAGGGFPLQVSGAGVVGVAAVSGLHERDDHGWIVTALCAEIGCDAAALSLPDQASKRAGTDPKPS